MQLYSTNIYILRRLLHVSNLRVLLQEDCCAYRYGIICLYTNCISSLIDEPSGSKHVEDTVKYKILD
jgi:hypothetical protein